MIFGLLVKIEKYNSNIFLFHPLGHFPSKLLRCPLIFCFDLLPLQYTDLTHQIWRFLVYIFLDPLDCRLILLNPWIKCSKKNAANATSKEKYYFRGGGGAKKFFKKQYTPCIILVFAIHPLNVSQIVIVILMLLLSSLLLLFMLKLLS